MSTCPFLLLPGAPSNTAQMHTHEHTRVCPHTHTNTRPGGGKAAKAL